MRTAPTGTDGFVVAIERSDGTVRRPSVLSDAQVQPQLNGRPAITLPLRPDLSWLDESWEGAALRVWQDGQRLPIDEVDSVEPQPGQTTLRGQGGAPLRARVKRDVTDSGAHALIRDVLDETGLSYTVDAAPTATNADVATIDSQQDWEAALDSGGDVPVTVTNGGLELLRSCYLASAGDISLDLAADPTQNWTVSEAVKLDVGGLDTAGWQIDVPYRIPADRVGVAIRLGEDYIGAVNVEIDGTEIGSIASSSQDGKPASWRQPGVPQDVPNLEPGTHDISLTTDSGGFGDGPTGIAYIDCAAVFDTEHHDPAGFDNTLNSDNLLDGPPGPYATYAYARLDGEGTVDRITGARADPTVSSGTVWSGLRPAPGGDWAGNLFRVADEDFGDDYPRFDVRLQLFSQNADVGNDVTTYRTQPSRVESLSLSADTIQTPTIADRTLDNRAAAILSQLCDEADLIWEVQWQDDSQHVVVTRPGQRTSTADPSLVDWQVTKDIGRQVTQVAVYGREEGVEGERFVADINNVALSYDHIQQGSERVYDPDSGETYERGADADYVMNYLLGTIRIVAGSAMTDGQSYRIDYQERAQGEAFAGGGISDDYPTVEEVPALRTDLQCERAANWLLRQGDHPIWSATVTIPSDVGFALTEAIDPSQIPTPPDGAGLRVESIDNQAGQVRLQLGVGRSLDELVSALQNKVSETARQA